ncbi:MAG: ParB/RepB/Spo0J family partition protein [Clostridia bacterium]|nr:ParB/RepB/Spo0J family partition protein [Clostridia bacterium]
MAAKKTGLGKGLDALFSSSPIEETPSVGEEGAVTFLKVTEVEPNKAQARKSFDEESLDELASSIKQYGVIQPIVVAKKSNYYEIIAGERRWRASKRAGLDEIPAIIREDDEQKNKEISLIENIQREDLNPIEKARGIKVLMDEYDLTQQKVADILGKSRSAIANTVRILNLDSRVIDLALEGKISEGHCKSLMSITDPEQQYEMAKYIVENGDSVRDIEKKVKVRKKVSKKKISKYEPIYRDIENTFQSFFGTKVKLDAGEKKGKIIINYSSNDDLERILGLIK